MHQLVCNINKIRNIKQGHIGAQRRLINLFFLLNKTSFSYLHVNQFLNKRVVLQMYAATAVHQVWAPSTASCATVPQSELRQSSHESPATECTTRTLQLPPRAIRGQQQRPQPPESRPQGHRRCGRRRRLRHHSPLPTSRREVRGARSTTRRQLQQRRPCPPRRRRRRQHRPMNRRIRIPYQIFLDRTFCVPETVSTASVCIWYPASSYF